MATITKKEFQKFMENFYVDTICRYAAEFPKEYLSGALKVTEECFVTMNKNISGALLVSSIVTSNVDTWLADEIHNQILKVRKKPISEDEVFNINKTTNVIYNALQDIIIICENYTGNVSDTKKRVKMILNSMLDYCNIGDVSMFELTYATFIVIQSLKVSHSFKSEGPSEFVKIIETQVSYLVNVVNILSSYTMLKWWDLKNNIVSNFKFKDGNLIAEQSKTPVISNDDWIFFKQNNFNIKTIVKRFEGNKIKSERFESVYGIGGNLQEWLKELSSLGKQKAEVLISNYTLPFYEKKIIGENKLMIEFCLQPNDVIDLKENKKYAMPENGCIIEFLKAGSHITHAEVWEDADKYCFKLIFKEGILQSIKGDKITEGLFYFNKAWLDIITSNEAEYIYQYEQLFSNWDMRSMYISGEDKIISVFKAAIIGCLLGILYVVYVDKNFLDIELSNRIINKDGSIERGDTYTTAHIRKLPKGYSSSIEARENAKKYGVKVPTGYTFVKEHIPKEGENKRVIKIPV